MKDLLEFIVKKLVKKPESVVVSEIDAEDKITLQLRVDKEDMGRVIGKQGKTIKAIRYMLAIASAKANKRTNLEMIEE